LKIGLIDIGTNSIRYLAADLGQSPPPVLARGLLCPRLGGRREADGSLRPEAVARTRDSLALALAELRLAGAETVTAVGTEALRGAPNREEFLREARKLGLEVRVLDGAEEAELAARGARDGLPGETQNFLLADVGGGSSEFIRPGRQASLPLGCVSLLEKHGDRLAEAATEGLARLPESFFRGAEGLIGTGGTFTTLAAVKLSLVPYRGEAVHGTVLEREWIARTFQRLASLPLPERGKIPGLPPDRADIILPGTAIVTAILERGNFRRVTVSDRGLIFGLLASFGAQAPA